MNTTYKLSDDVIAALGKLLQLAILTGTDVTDWFRMIQVSPSTDDASQLVVAEEYRDTLDKQIEKLEAQANSLMEQIESESN